MGFLLLDHGLPSWVEETIEEGITPTRSLNLLYIIIDSIFIVALLLFFIWKKRYRTLIFALLGGIIYVIVDYCGFYLASHSRTIWIWSESMGMWTEASSAQYFWILFWMSMSYGITNFAFMWTCATKDKLWKYIVFFIVVWWLICPSISELGGEASIVTSRTTGAYHGYMGIALIVCYFALACYFIIKKQPIRQILILFAIGFAVQFGWEFAMLINGIRPMTGGSVITLLVDSLLETNLGMPAVFIIYLVWDHFMGEDLKRRHLAPGKTLRYAFANFDFNVDEYVAGASLPEGDSASETVEEMSVENVVAMDDGTVAMSDDDVDPDGSEM